MASKFSTRKVPVPPRRTSGTVVDVVRSLLPTLTLALMPAVVWAQPVVVRSDPPRATLVCDGVVLGVTPVRISAARPRTCTLFARGHENLSFIPAQLTGAITSLRLVPITAPSPPSPPPASEGTSCGEIDPRTGLIRVCFAGESAPRREAPGARIPRRTPVPCGAIDPATGLIRVCFPGERAPAPTPAPAPSRTPSGPVPCGHLDPATGLINFCFPTRPQPPPTPQRRTPVPCGTLDPSTGLIRICFPR